MASSPAESVCQPIEIRTIISPCVLRTICIKVAMFGIICVVICLNKDNLIIL